MKSKLLSMTGTLADFVVIVLNPVTQVSEIDLTCCVWCDYSLNSY